jgi:hypothetical protein
MSFYTEKTIKKTKKPHRCFGCGEKIPEETQAVYFAGKSDDGFTADYLCTKCHAVISECDYVRESIGSNDGYNEGDIKEFCHNCGNKNTCEILEGEK